MSDHCAYQAHVLIFFLRQVKFHMLQSDQSCSDYFMPPHTSSEYDRNPQSVNKLGFIYVRHQRTSHSACGPNPLEHLTAMSDCSFSPYSLNTISFCSCYYVLSLLVLSHLCKDITEGKDVNLETCFISLQDISQKECMLWCYLTLLSR